MSNQQEGHEERIARLARLQGRAELMQSKYSAGFEQGYFDCMIDIMIHFDRHRKKEDWLTGDILKEINKVYNKNCPKNRREKI